MMEIGDAGTFSEITNLADRNEGRGKKPQLVIDSMSINAVRERSCGGGEQIGCKNNTFSSFVNNKKERQQQRATWHFAGS